MATLYRLRFRSPLHIGERGVGLEETREYLPADTLFSAICTAWRWLYGEQSLTHQLLDPFVAGSPSFLLTSAFPFAGDVLFFPRPQGNWDNVQAGNLADRKSIKRLRWLSQDIFRRWISGEQILLSDEQVIMDGSVWLEDADKKSLAKLIDPSTGDINLFRAHNVPRVTLDRITQASNIWFLRQVLFAKDSGLWLAIEYRDMGVRSQVEACLRLLGDCGLGGERNAGCGLFLLDPPQDIDLPEVSDAGYGVTLAPLCPRAHELPTLLGSNTAYEVMARRGWVGSPEGGNLRRQVVYMFAEGSVFSTPTVSPVGQLVNVKPAPCPHDVWRYGYAYLLGVKR